MQDPVEIIIGIDPGTTTTGYGIIAVERQGLHAIDFGCIRPPAHYKLSDRYLIIFESIEELLEKFQPTVMAVETQFAPQNRTCNVRSVIKLGMACGIAIITAKRKGLPVFEYAPAKAKRAVVGNGRASKEQVGCMVQRLLRLPTLPFPEDASDALALAICHAHASKMPSKLNVAI